MNTRHAIDCLVSKPISGNQIESSSNNEYTSQDVDLNVYGMKLYARHSEGTLLKCAIATFGEWQPQPNMCHENVTTWCDYDPSYRPVRGWLYMSEIGTFLAHSVVRIPNGELRDITPMNASQYPFIIAEESEAEYEDLIVRRGISQVVHQQSQSPLVILARQLIP